MKLSSDIFGYDMKKLKETTAENVEKIRVKHVEQKGRGSGS